MANFAQAFGVTNLRSTSVATTAARVEPPRVRLGMSSDMADDFLQESPADTQERIQGLVDAHPVLLFMKGSKIFPQCGFSNTATQILES